MRSFSIFSLILCLALCGLRSTAFAQSAAATGTISGVVTDITGAAIPGAIVTIKNTDSSSARTLTSDGSGAFAATFLPAGAYTVEVRASGFQAKKPARVALGAGSSVRVEARMSLPRVSEEVTVTGTAPTVEGQTTAPAVNKQEAVVANSIAGLTVTYLPNRNRDFSQFAQLAAGAQPDADENGLVVAGQRPEDSKMAIDGADFNDPLNGGQRGARDGALFFPQTVVREFQIVHAGATAEVGGTNAGFVNVVTKSGANKRRAEGFFIGRPATLTSRDAFGHSLDNQQYEFGGSVGGPIKKDRAFFYLGAEQDFLRVPYWSQFAPQAPGTAIPVALAAQQGQIVSHTNPTALFARTDFLLGKANTLNLQLNFNRVDSTNLNDGSTRVLTDAANQMGLQGDSEWLRGNLTTILTPALVNQVLVQWSRDYRRLSPNSLSAEQDIVGFGVLSGNAHSLDVTTAQRAQWSDDIAVTHGGGLFHFGGYFSYEPVSAQGVPYRNTRFDYLSLASFLTPSTSLTVPYFRARWVQLTGWENDTYDAAIRHSGAYADTKFPLTSKLTLSAGIRWEAQWNPRPPRPNTLVAQTAHVASDLAQVQPRVGMAWNPGKTTVIRTSAGLYDAATPATYFRRAFVDNGFNTVLNDSYYGWAALLGPPRSARVFVMSPAFRNPRSLQASATIEQQIGAKANLSVGYLRNSTWALPRALDTNLSPPTYDATGMPVFPVSAGFPVRPHPEQAGQILQFSSSAHSTYDGMLMTATFQLPRRSSLTANYTLAHTRDDDTTTGPYGRDAALDPFNLRLERADSNLDVRHNFNLNAVVNLPAGFKFNPIVIARSGLPYTPIIGYDTQHDGNDLNDRAVINGKVAGRNSLRQPGFFNLDFRFVKDITLRGEGHHLDLFLDVFNVTGASNRNFGPEAVSWFGTPSAPVFSAAQPLFAPATTRFGSARQLQFTARIVAF
jgi:hypothetical protein